MRQAKLQAEAGSTVARSVLKLRAFEMVLVLFYLEDLKATVVGSIRATPLKAVALPQSTKDLYKKAWRMLVADGIITDAEREDIEALIDYRNVIAHQIQHMTGDVGEYAEFSASKYESGALARLMKYRKKIFAGLCGRYVFQIGFRGLLFAAAEKTYKEELARLQRRITKQFVRVQREVDRANAAIEGIPASLQQELQPGHRRHTATNGSLSKSGAACCRRLFESGATPLAVAHLMGTSIAAARRHPRMAARDGTRQQKRGRQP